MRHVETVNEDNIAGCVRIFCINNIVYLTYRLTNAFYKTTSDRNNITYS